MCMSLYICINRMNLDQANRIGKITDWGDVRYRATTFYDIPDCSPSSWQAALTRGFTDDKLYHNHLVAYFRGEVQRQEKIDRIGTLCGALSINQQQYRTCHNKHYTRLFGAPPSAEVSELAYKQQQERNNYAC
jgi:hypothetical protein